ncbi:hypothetical protein AAMO2058_001736000 [Amorphochlora amoebiformis]
MSSRRPRQLKTTIHRTSDARPSDENPQSSIDHSSSMRRRSSTESTLVRSKTHSPFRRSKPRGIHRADFCSDFVFMSDADLISILDSGDSTRNSAPSLRSPYGSSRSNLSSSTPPDENNNSFDRKYDEKIAGDISPARKRRFEERRRQAEDRKIESFGKRRFEERRRQAEDRKIESFGKRIVRSKHRISTRMTRTRRHSA